MSAIEIGSNPHEPAARSTELQTIDIGAVIAHSHYEVDVLDLDKYTQAEVDALISGGDGYTHPNHTGQITSDGDGDQTLHISAITDWTIQAEVDGNEHFLVGNAGTLFEVPLAQIVDYLNDPLILDDVGAGIYSHPNHTGQVTSDGDGDQTLSVTAITDFNYTAGLIGGESFLIEDTTLKRLGLAQLESYLNANLNFGGSYSHPNHHGQVDSNGDEETALNYTAISAQGGHSGLVGSETLLMQDGSSLYKVALAQLETYLEASLAFAAASHEHTESDITDLGSYLEDITSQSISQLSDVNVGGATEGSILEYQFGTWSVTSQYSHPNHSGHITSSGDGATVLQSTAITDHNIQGSLDGNEHFLADNSGTLFEVPMSQMEAYFNSNLDFAPSSHSHILPVAKVGLTGTSTSETLILSDANITNAVYEGNIDARLVKVTINYAWTQTGGATPSAIFVVKLGTTTLISSTTATSSAAFGTIVFWVGAASITNSHVKYLNIYNAVVQDQSSQSSASVVHGTGDGINIYIDGNGDISWVIESATIELIG